MTYNFKIIKIIWHHNRGDFIFTRHLGNTHDFPIPDGALLEDLPVYHYEAMRFIKDEQGMLQEDIFVFQPMSLKRLPENYFTKGQLVTLAIPG